MFTVFFFFLFLSLFVILIFHFYIALRSLFVHPFERFKDIVDAKIKFY